MKYPITLAFFFCFIFGTQSIYAQTYQWGGKQITKKEWNNRLNEYTNLFVKYYNSENAQQTQSDIALVEKLIAENAEGGLAVLVDLKSNKIVSKSGFTKKGKDYVMDTTLFNKPIEPGSLMLPMSAAMIMDNYGVTLNDTTNLEGGKTILNGRVIVDAEHHDIKTANLKQIIAESSNVGIAKMVDKTFMAHNYELNFKDVMNDYVGTPKIIPNEDILTSQIPYQSFGYGVLLTPNEIFNFYKRVAQSDSTLFKHPETLTQVQVALAEVATNGTAKSLFRGAKYIYAAKTGTVLVADPKKGYANNQFQSEFIGYDNNVNPSYACMVIIKCKPQALNHFGATVAGPVFKSIIENALQH